MMGRMQPPTPNSETRASVYTHNYHDWAAASTETPFYRFNQNGTVVVSLMTQESKKLCCEK